jgi:serine/threonine protein kinase
MAEFLKLIKQGGIDRPEAKVIEKLRHEYVNQLGGNIDNVDAAMNLYRMMKEIPSTTTRTIIKDQLQIRVNGAMSIEKPNILTACHKDGTQLVIKLLYINTDDYRPHRTKLAQIEHEIACCTALSTDSQRSELALVPCTVRTVDVPQDFTKQSGQAGNFDALVMPRYLQSLAKSPHLYEEHLVVQGVRLVKALDYMHGKGYVHMDVKADNIFMDAAGNLFLGDFGSACKENQVITSTTAAFYHRDIIGEPARPQYDWYMLLVTLLIEFGGKEGWSDRLIRNDLNHQQVSHELVMREADRYLSSPSSELKELLGNLRTKCDDNLKSES